MNKANSKVGIFNSSQVSSPKGNTATFIKPNATNAPSEMNRSQFAHEYESHRESLKSIRSSQDSNKSPVKDSTRSKGKRRSKDTLESVDPMRESDVSRPLDSKRKNQPE
jgi:hypothetical protein